MVGAVVEAVVEAVVVVVVVASCSENIAVALFLRASSALHCPSFRPARTEAKDPFNQKMEDEFMRDGACAGPSCSRCVRRQRGRERKEQATMRILFATI